MQSCNLVVSILVVLEFLRLQWRFPDMLLSRNVRFFVLPRILHGLGMCCHCSLKWQIDASDEADVFRWCNEIIMIQLFPETKQRKEKKLIAYCALLYTLVFFIVVHQFSKFPQVN
jgi:hypothetical protein